LFKINPTEKLSPEEIKNFVDLKKIFLGIFGDFLKIRKPDEK